MNQRLAFLADVAERRNVVREKGVSNCIGTALYLIGEQSEDAGVYDEIWFGDENRGDHTKLVKSFKRLDSPETGSLIAWVNELDSRLEKGEIYHMGVVANQEPLLVAYRRKVEGRFYRNSPFESANNGFGDKTNSVVFFMPPKLERAMKGGFE